MQRIVTFLMIFFLEIVSTNVSAQVNGYKEDIQGIPVIHAWGSDYEMGYALGYLDGDRFAIMMEQIILPSYGIYWELERTCFNTYFTVHPRIEEMISGIIDGIGDRPDSLLFSPTLGRYYDNLDIHVGNALTDITAVMFGKSDQACTSLSAWDAATASDPELLGAPLLARNLDSEYHPLLAEMHVIKALSPDSGNRTVTYGYPISLDCSTAMNEHGVCVTRNAAYHDTISSYDPPFMPIGYAALIGLMEEDFDSSGVYDLEDLLTALTTWNRAPSKNLHVIAPRTIAYMDEPAVVVEINNDQGYVFRTAESDPVLGPEHMAATNHFRLLYPPSACSRYELLSDSIAADPAITINRSWNLMGECDITGWWTYLSVIFLPESRKTGIAFCDSIEESWEKDPVWFTWDMLFPSTGIEPTTRSNEINFISIFPNPSSSKITIELSRSPQNSTHMTMYNPNGQQLITQPITKPQTEIDISYLPVGIYIVKVWNDKDVLVQKVVKQ